jgi:hypothetical protein
MVQVVVQWFYLGARMLSWIYTCYKSVHLEISPGYFLCYLIAYRATLSSSPSWVFNLCIVTSKFPTHTGPPLSTSTMENYSSEEESIAPNEDLRALPANKRCDQVLSLEIGYPPGWRFRDSFREVCQNWLVPTTSPHFLR